MQTTEGGEVAKELLETLILEATGQVVTPLAAGVSTAHSGIPGQFQIEVWFNSSKSLLELAEVAFKH